MRKIYDKAEHKGDKAAQVNLNPKTLEIAIVLPGKDVEVTVTEARKLEAFGDGLDETEALVMIDAIDEGINARMPEGDNYRALRLFKGEIDRIDETMHKLEATLTGGDEHAKEKTEKARKAFKRSTGYTWHTLSMLASIDDPAIRTLAANGNRHGLDWLRQDKIQRKAIAVAKLHTIDRRRWMHSLSASIVEKIDRVMSDEIAWKRLPKRVREKIVDRKARLKVSREALIILDRTRAEIASGLDMED